MNGSKKAVGMPEDTAIVVMTEAPIKNGNIFLKSMFSEDFPAFFARRSPRKSVMGIIASVRVSLTVPAFYEKRKDHSK